MSKRLFFIAGEASGDVYGAYLIELLIQQHAEVDIIAVGGDKMKTAGATIVHHIRELSIMGFVEVVKNFSKIKGIFRSCQSHILSHKTETIIFIDFPGFNLRMANWAKSKGIHTVQYISPKVWAWKESRITKIKKDIDTLICVFPFEVDYFNKFNVNVHYFGNPLHHLIKSHIPGEPAIRSQKEIIGLMPGSRKQEIKRVLPVLLDLSNELLEYEFIIGGMTLIGRSFYEDILKSNFDNVSIIMDRNYDLLHVSDYMINTSGTITLESLLFKKPQVVVYATHPISYFIISKMIKLDHIALPNIIANQTIVPELIQHNLTAANIKDKLNQIQSSDFKKNYNHIAEQLVPRNEEKLVALILGA